jgi:hypothetical protein
MCIFKHPSYGQIYCSDRQIAVAGKDDANQNSQISLALINSIVEADRDSSSSAPIISPPT